MSDMNKGKELYTPEELIWATQLAYCNFKDGDESDIDKTVQEIVSERGPEIFYDYDDTFYPNEQKVNSYKTKSQIQTPKFDFHTGKRVPGKVMKVPEKSPIIIEGIHALNELMSESIPSYQKYKIFIAPQIQINFDNHSPLNMTDL